MLLTLLFVVVRTTPPRGWYFVVSCGLVDGFLAGRREGEHEVPPFSLLLGRINNSSANKKFSTNQIRTTKNNAARRTFPFTSRLHPPPPFSRFYFGSHPLGFSVVYLLISISIYRGVAYLRFPLTQPKENKNMTEQCELGENESNFYEESVNSVADLYPY